jgi:ribosomal protein L7/L12
VTSAGSNVSLTPEQSLLPPEVLQLALSGRKREAMKKYREMTGSSRWEAKSVLEGL